MPILVSLLGLTLMLFGSRAAIHEKEELNARPMTWQGEMLMPPTVAPTPSPSSVKSSEELQ